MIPNGCLLTHSLAYLPEATGKCKPVSFLHCNRPKSPRHCVLSSGVSKAPPQPLFWKILTIRGLQTISLKIRDCNLQVVKIWPFGPCSDPTPSPGSHGFCWLANRQRWSRKCMDTAANNKTKRWALTQPLFLNLRHSENPKKGKQKNI